MISTKAPVSSISGDTRAVAMNLPSDERTGLYNPFSCRIVPQVVRRRSRSAALPAAITGGVGVGVSVGVGVIVGVAVAAGVGERVAVGLAVAVAGSVAA